MNREKAKLSDILGERKPCYFSSLGERPFKYSDKCRDCLDKKYYYNCENYTPVINNHQQTKPQSSTPELVKDGESRLLKDKTVDDIIKRNESQIEKNDKILRPFFWYHQSLHVPILPRPKKTIERLEKQNARI